MANETAPAAAASANSQVGKGGRCEIAPISFMAPAGARRPASRSSIVCAMDAARIMWTPLGSAATTETSLASPSSA